MKLIFISFIFFLVRFAAGLYNNGTQPEQIPTNVPDSGIIAIVTILVATLLVLVLTVVSLTCPTFIHFSHSAFIPYCAQL